MPLYKELGDNNVDGTRMGQTSLSKVGFLGATPTSQFAAAAQATVSTAAVTVASSGVTTLALANAVNSLVVSQQSLVAMANAVRNALVSFGFIKGSA